MFAIFKVKVTAVVHMIKIWFSLLYLLNCWFLAIKHRLMIHQIHKPECLVKKWITAFKVKVAAKGQNVNVCPDDIVQTTKHFATKLGTVMHRHELGCQAKDWFAVFKDRVTAVVHTSKYDSFYYIFWTAEPFTSKLILIVHYHKPKSYGKNGLLCSRSRSQQHFKMSVNVCPDNIFWISEWPALPACPSLMCFFSRGDTGGLVLRGVCVRYLRMFCVM